MNFYSKYVPNGSKMAQDGLKWSQVGHHIWPRWAPDGPRCFRKLQCGIVIEKVEKASGGGGRGGRKRVPNGAKHVHKRAHGDTYGGQIATLSKNGNVEKT